MRMERSVLRFLFASLFATVVVACGAAEPSPRPSDARRTTSPTPLDASPPGTRLLGEPETPIPIEADDIVSGNGDAPVTLVAFLDYECGFCAQGFGRLAELRGKYDRATLRLVLKQLPLDFHPEALPAAIAAQSVKLIAGDEAALDYSALLFGGQGSLGAEAYAEFAEKLGVDRDLYREAVTSEETIARIGADVLLSRKLGVSGTPAFFVNGRLLAGAYPLETFTELIDEERKETLALASDGDVRRAYARRVRENSARSLAVALLADDPRTHRVDLGDSPREGDPRAKVTLVVFTDFECPYCKKADSTLTELRKIYGRDLRVVWKHLPLPFHRRALPAARVGRLVQKTKGDEAFFRFASATFATSPNLDDDVLRAHAVGVGVAREAVERALRGDPDLDRAIEKDVELADDLLARGTPHFFVNGLRLSGARPLSHFQAVIDEAKRRAEALLHERPDASVYEELTRDGVVPGAPARVSTAIPSTGRPRKGAPNAKVTIHVWSDFECPYCRKAEEVLAELDQEFPGELAIVWHDLPLDFHEQAGPAARLGGLVFREKGSAGFFRYHDLVFALEGTAARVSTEELLGHARALGVTEQKARDALASGSLSPEMEEDAKVAESLGIRGTPAFVVGGYLVTGAQPKRHFERLIRLAKGASAPTVSPSPEP